MSYPSIHQWFEENLLQRQTYLQPHNIQAYRLYNNEHSDLPVTVDIYGEYAVINVFQEVQPQTLHDMEKALKKILQIQAFYYKDRTKEKLDLPKSQPREIPIEEYGHKFHINLSDYMDTGLFLDHRETRRWIGEQSKDKTVLNTFAYTGSFSIYAAAGGAAKTYSVDLSRTYCDWIKKNLALNRLPEEKNWVYKMDTLEFFKYAARKKLSFDIIIIDPPTFSKNKNDHFSVQKDHPQLINAALKVLTPQGFILFSNNYRDFHLNHKDLTPCEVTEKKDTIPPDFADSIPHRCWIIKPK